jgi:hypothetical protein
MSNREKNRHGKREQTGREHTRKERKKERKKVKIKYNKLTLTGSWQIPLAMLNNQELKK